MDYHSRIAAINKDRGSQFYANGGERKKKGVSRFEWHLISQGIKHIPFSSGIIQRQTVRSNGGFRNIRGIDGGLIQLFPL